MRILFAIAVYLGLEILQVDTKTAFGKSDLDIFIRQPERFISKRNPNLVLKLNATLYGLKQSCRMWYLLLYYKIVESGFEVCSLDTSIYDRTIFLAVYGDDILILGSNRGRCTHVY